MTAIHASARERDRRGDDAKDCGSTRNRSPRSRGRARFQARKTRRRIVRPENHRVKAFSTTRAGMRPPTRSGRTSSFSRGGAGLGRGATVDFRVLKVGEVKAIVPRYERAKHEITTVAIDFFQEHLFQERARTGEITRSRGPARAACRARCARRSAARTPHRQVYIGPRIRAGDAKSGDVSRRPTRLPRAR